MTIENGHYEFLVCEGLGTFGIHKENDIYYLIVTYEGDVVEYSTFLQAFQLLHNEKVKNRKKNKRE